MSKILLLIVIFSFGAVTSALGQAADPRVLSDILRTIRPLLPQEHSPQSSATSSGKLSDHPSIDCRRVALQARSLIGSVLCSGAEGAAADWDLNSAFWAYYGGLNPADQKAADKAEDQWRRGLIVRCQLPQSVFGISLAQRKCVLAEVHRRAEFYRSKLAGDALNEAQLSPDLHGELQRALADRGLLADAPDGEFGLNTRAAIKRFQEQTGEVASGFLSSQQMRTLLASGTKPDRSSPTAGDPNLGKNESTRLSEGEREALVSRLRSAWKIDGLMDRPENLIVDVRMKLGRDHKLVGVPEIINKGTSQQANAAADAAILAIIRSQPFDMLNDATFAAWKELEVTFDPRIPAGQNTATTSPTPPAVKTEEQATLDAASSGDTDAQFKLAGMYATGKGMPTDSKQAATWWRKAAEQGHAQSQLALGIMYEVGDANAGTPKDISIAEDWYKKAAAQGLPEAKARLGDLYAKRDPDDVVAQVLNYSTFGQDEGGSELADLMKLAGKPAPDGGYWYRIDGSTCVYRLHPGKSIAGAMLGRKEIDLNGLDPKNITFRYDDSRSLWGSGGMGTVVQHLNDTVIIAAGQLNMERLQRGWALIYQKYCRGKHRAF
ncbi:peptidoglycan-binding protein [Bradyrhizobium iriomotense]|uniref:peptidoglycan-binding protein n=1 Tax=Bradyrhizobium iriomotense TaxID=441950 RepID=UPI001B8A83DF|nr:peptidoglycan-binding protein [Bradyrhizobium iriomotense]MBR0783934.1 SEL1-like repeat protein [Bradyrhizobium iriomotense]